MYLKKDGFKIDGVAVDKYITEIQFEYNKLWASDSGRDLQGNQKGTFLGVYPKFVVKFGELNEKQLETIVPLIDKAYQNITYSDPNKKKTITIETYSSDYSINYKGMDSNDGFSISFIARKKR